MRQSHMGRWASEDEQFMRRALDLAQKGQGKVEPNPMVGCVIVRNGRVVGEGYHRKYGGAHAEPNALRKAASRAGGSTVYVTLEPCSHHGKTPPCVEALIRAQVARVVAAMKDPNPLVAGRGFKKLRAAGIETGVGLLRKEAAELNAPFITYHCKGRPYVILKWAQSIDGKIATRTGDSQWITSRQSRAAAHRIRARVDGIIVGVGTVLADDPDLTARLAKPKRIAARIVLDSRLRIPTDAKLVSSAKRVPTLIATALSPRAKRDKQRILRRAGCEILSFPSHTSGIDLLGLLIELHRRQMTNVMVEGGGRVLGDFLRRNLADEAHIFVAPKLIGGEAAPGPLRNLGPARMTDLPHATLVEVSHHGPDICYNAKFG